MSDYKLKPSIKKKWVDALRSGTYDKTSDQLCRKRLSGNCSFCVLGVLVNETVGFRFPEQKVQNVGKEAPALNDSMPCNNLLNKYFKKGHVPVRWGNIKLCYKNRLRALVALNDSRKLTFNQLADLIEEQL